MKINSDFREKYDEIERKNQTLRDEVSNLKVQNQVLRTRLNCYQDFRYLVKRAIKTGLSETYEEFRRIKRKLRQVKHSFKLNGLHNKYDNNYNQSFKPYEVKILTPLQDERPRIVHALGNFFTGGSSRLVVDLIEHLGHQFEQEIITCHKSSLPSYVGQRIYYYPRLTSCRQVLSYFKRFKPDIIHVHYWGEGDWEWYDNVFQAAQKYGCKIIENINIPVEPYVSESINRYVYVSDVVKHEFGYPNSQNLTIYPGSNFNLFKRDNLELPKNCIGMVYRLDRDKLNEHAINVFIEVVKRRKGTKALIVGGGYYLETYKNAVQQAGVSEAFTFTGLVSYEELPKLYEQMSIFVAPVYRESFGQVSPFAMNMGIPVVGYKVGAIEEIIGDSHLLAPPEDTSELANIIIELLDDHATLHKIGVLNHQRAQELFSVEVMINNYRTLYKEMIDSDV